MMSQISPDPIAYITTPSAMTTPPAPLPPMPPMPDSELIWLIFAIASLVRSLAWLSQIWLAYWRSRQP
jgi:hypothetical protein